MSEEKLTVLRMVADKKITVEQAATLLDALHQEPVEQRGATPESQDYGNGGEKTYRHQHEPGRPKNAQKSGWEFTLQDLSRNIEAIVADATQGIGADWFGKRPPFGRDDESWGEATLQEYTPPDGSSLDIRCVGGNLVIRGIDGDQIRFPRGSEWDQDTLRPRIAIDAENKRVEVRVSGRSEEIEVPWSVINLIVNVVGGNSSVSDIAADCQFSVNGGNISIDRLTGALQVNANGGSITCSQIASNQISLKVNGGNTVLQLNPITEGTVNLKAKGGNVQLRLSRESSFRVEASSKFGSVDTEIPGTRSSTLTESIFHAVHGDGAADITIKAVAGNIGITTE